MRHRQALRAALDARRAPAGRQRDDVEEQGELLHDPRPAWQHGHSAGGDPLPARGRPLPQAAQLHLRGPRPRQGGARADPRPGRAARRGRPARGRRGRPRRRARRRARPSTRRSPTTSTRPRPWPRSTASSAAPTPCSPRGRSPARAPPASGPSSRRWTRSSACCFPAAGTIACRRRSRRSSTSGRTRAGSATSPRADAARGRARGAGHRARGHAQGHALAAQGGEPVPVRVRPRGPTAGTPGEDLACAHLRRHGLAILARNYRCRAGEIDVVAGTGGTVVFVEVKERRGESHGRRSRP